MAETYSIVQTGARSDSTFDAKALIVPDSAAITPGAWQQACRLGTAQLYKGADGGVFFATPDPTASTYLGSGVVTLFAAKPGIN